MLLLSIPNVPRLTLQSSSPGKSHSTSSPRKRRKYEIEDEEPDPTLDDHLEYLMDKLSVWQLVTSLDILDDDSHKNDWAQDFCTKVVEPLSVNCSPYLSRITNAQLKVRQGVTKTMRTFTFESLPTREYTRLS
jgi:hypothetical protein